MPHSVHPSPLTPPHPDSGRLRQMQETDLEGVLQIESVSFGPYHWSADAFRNEMANPLSSYYSLLVNDTVIGYCGFWQIIDEIHVTTLAIAPSHRGQHWGEILVALVVDKALGYAARWITLEVRASNTAAIQLYQHYGFQSQGLRPRYYVDNHEDAVIMTTHDLRTDEYRALYQQKLLALQHKLAQKQRQLPLNFEGYRPLVSTHPPPVPCVTPRP